MPVVKKSEYETKVDELSSLHGLDAQAATNAVLDQLEKKGQKPPSESELDETLDDLAEKDEKASEEEEQEESSDEDTDEDTGEDEDEEEEEPQRSRRSFEERFKLERQKNRRLESRLSRLERRLIDVLERREEPHTTKKETIFDEEDDDTPPTRKEMKRMFKSFMNEIKAATQQETRRSREADAFHARASESEVKARETYVDYDDVVNEIIKPQLTYGDPDYNPELVKLLARSQNPAKIAYMLAKEELGEEPALRRKSERKESSGEDRVAEALERRMRKERARTFDGSGGSPRRVGKKPSKLRSDLFTKLVEASEEEMKLYEEEYGGGA